MNSEVSTAEHDVNREARAQRVIEYVDQKLATLEPVIDLLQARHDIFKLKPYSDETGVGTLLDSSRPIKDQLYDEPTYNREFIRPDLSLRQTKGAALEFHNETEKYNPDPSDEPELADQKMAYRKAILKAGQMLGFVVDSNKQPTHPEERTIGILPSELEPIDQDVEAVVVAGAAGMSGYKRMRDTLRNIKSGAIKTDHIIIASCDRPVGDGEKNTISGGEVYWTAGDTEADVMWKTLHHFTGAQLTDDFRMIPVHYGKDLEARVQSTEIVINNKVIKVDLVSAPFDPLRKVGDPANNQFANRANTEETFLAAGELLSKKEGGLVVIESHDAWVPYQEVIGQMTFGLQNGKSVVATGPFNAERVYRHPGYDLTNLDMNSAEGVVDEIDKVYHDLVELRLIAENYRLAA